MVATIAACGHNTALAHQQDAAVGQHSMPVGADSKLSHRAD
jgi:hypothetical protein